MRQIDTTSTRRTRKGRSPTSLGALALGLGIALAGCDPDDLLTVDDPQYLDPADADIGVLVDGAIGDFQVWYSGDTQGLHDEGFATVTGAFTDELKAAGTFTTRNRLDRRDQLPGADGNHADAAYLGLHQARRSAREAANQLDPDEPDFALMRSLEAYTFVALGEGWCGAVPFSQEEDGEFVFGEMQSTQEIFDGAIERFDEVLAADPGSHLAAVGKARALLSQGRYGEAADAVGGVPTTWTHFVEHSVNTSRQQNPFFSLMRNGRWSVADSYGGNGLPFRTAGDPRTPYFDDGVGFDGSTPLFITDRYPSQSSNLPVADGIEARLIEAEAALHEGGDWLGILNELREDYVSLMSARFDDYEALITGPGGEPLYEDLDPLEDPGDFDAQVDLVFAERAFWMYGTGKRMGDLRRLVREYGRDQAEVFPTGTRPHEGDSFGTNVAFDIPFDEENNPHFDSAACDVNEA